MTSLRRVPTSDLTPEERDAIRALCDAAWGGPDQTFDDDDWQHALGGVHVLVQEAGEIAVMREVNDHVDRSFALGALSTGVPAFYGRLGWIPWTGPTSVRVDGGERRTPDEDGGVLVRLTPSSPDLDPAAPLSCDWRPGDVW
jgi:aminoglycoside 2'-N-acetyltransferase I